MSTRPYAMRARAASKDATRDEILAAVVDLAMETESLDFPLESVAARANRSVQTILRHFGSRDGLIEAGVEHGSAIVEAERRAPDGDPSTALDLLIDHYELRGRFMLRMLALGDDRTAGILTGSGRLLHRAWVAEVFAESIARAGRPADEVIDLLVVATDLSTWRLLALDRGLDRETVRARMGLLVDAVIAATAGEVA